MPPDAYTFSPAASHFAEFTKSSVIPVSDTGKPILRISKWFLVPPLPTSANPAQGSGSPQLFVDRGDGDSYYLRPVIPSWDTGKQILRISK